MRTEIRFTVYGRDYDEIMVKAREKFEQLLGIVPDSYDIDIRPRVYTYQDQTVIWEADIHAEI